MPTVQRLITINWTPVTDVSAIGYNIYLVKGAPENNTKSLLAFVNGVSTSSYNYTAIEGQQYQFEVRATDGANESAPLEIFYPNGQALWTPTVLTPTGQPMMTVRDGQYITSTEFINYANGLKFNTNSPIYTSGALDSYLKAATGQVNRICRRHFDVQIKDEIYPNVRVGTDYPKLITIFLQEKPIQNINSVYIQVLKWFIQVDLSYLQLEPEAGYYQFVPMLSEGYTNVPLPSAVLIDGLLGKVWTNYSFGYDIIPEEIKIATSLIASKLIALGSQNPVSGKSVRFGRNFQLEWDKDNDPIMNMAKDLLRPYIKYSFGRANNPM